MVATGPGTTRRCPSCGAEVLPGQRFCPTCGTDLDAAAAATTPSPPAIPAPPPGSAMPQPVAGTTPGAGTETREPAPPWPAWLGVLACGAFAIGAGLDWVRLGDFSSSSFDIPFAALFSDTAGDGLSIGVVLVVIAAIGVAVALLAPRVGALATGFLVVGAIAVLVVVWYLVRILTGDNGGASILAIGYWLALAGAILTLVSALALLPHRRRVATA